MNIGILPTLRLLKLQGWKEGMGKRLQFWSLLIKKKKKKYRVRPAPSPAMKRGLTVRWESYAQCVRLMKASDSFGKIQPVCTTLPFHYAKTRESLGKMKVSCSFGHKHPGLSLSLSLKFVPPFVLQGSEPLSPWAGTPWPHTQFSNPCLLLLRRVNKDFISQFERYTP